jgi:PAS domain S-box-containing protein
MLCTLHSSTMREVLLLPMHSTSNTPASEQTITPSPTDMPATQVDDAYRFFFERALVMLCIAGADGYLNSMWERVLGYTHAELCSAPFIAFVHPDDQDVETITFENRYRYKDGTYRWLRWLASPDHEHGLIIPLRVM